MHRIDSRAQLYFVAPYWATTTAQATSPKKRPSLLSSLQKYLNEKEKDCSWVIEKFSKPRTIRFRKYGQLVRPVSLRSEFTESISGILGPEHFDGIFARITYFDYGIGNIEICVGVKNISAESLDVLAGVFDECKLAIVDELVSGVPHADFDLEQFNDRIGAFLERRSSGLKNRLKPVYDGSIVTHRSALMCGPISRNLLFIDSGVEGSCFQASSESIEQLARKFLNQVNIDSGNTGSSIIPINHEGFEGAVALVNRRADSRTREQEALSSGGGDFADQVSREDGEVKRTKLLWSLVHMYWSSFFCASEGLYSILARQSGDRKMRLAEIRAEYEDLESYKQIIATLRFESRPEKVVVEGEDRLRYSAIWFAYEAESLLETLDKINDDLANKVSNLRDRAQRIVQSRAASMIAIFTALTIFSLVADVIQLYDVPQVIAPLLRIAILASGSLAIFVFVYGASYLFSNMSGRARRKNK